MLLTVLFSLLLILTGCSDKEAGDVKGKESQKTAEQTKEEKKSEIEEESKEEALKDLPPIPEASKDLFNQPAGKYAGQGVSSDENLPKLKEDLEKIGKIPKSASEEELAKLFQYYYSLVSEDLPDPNEVLKKWEFVSFGNPDIPDSKYQFKENYNVQIILDSSGSMAQEINGTSKMKLAKAAIKNFVSSLPEEAQVSLTVYGHKGTGDDKDKKLSCSSIEQVYGFATYNSSKFDGALNKFQPSGWTPVAGSLIAAKDSFKGKDATKNSNLIFLVSDGIETCDGDPVQAAKDLKNTNIQPIINVIGFDVDNKGQEQLKEVAKASEGMYTSVNNPEQLNQEFDRAKEVIERWKQWKQNALSEAEAKNVNQYFEALSFTNDWYFAGLNQSNNLDYIITNAFVEGYITNEQKQSLLSKKNKITSLMEETQKEMENDFNSFRENSFEDAKKMIEEKYQTNTN
ncbi:vWA domain-containing protein [Neobacillus sp. SCS-31]|uniref:vWA domain-containing protein n=1 Tax=Neobacillus oceani TaxID=3115292 RepID=UPI003906BD3B